MPIRTNTAADWVSPDFRPAPHAMPANLTIAEIRRETDALNQQIYGLLTDFEAKTDCPVVSVDLYTQRRADGRDTLADVKCRVDTGL